MRTSARDGFTTGSTTQYPFQRTVRLSYMRTSARDGFTDRSAIQHPFERQCGCHILRICAHGGSDGSPVTLAPASWVSPGI